MLLVNKYYYNQSLNASSEYWKGVCSDGKCDLSEQFFMLNLYGPYNNYCEGGDSAFALQGWVRDQKTFELQENYPYDYTKYEKEHSEKVGTYSPKIDENNYNNIIQSFKL